MLRFAIRCVQSTLWLLQVFIDGVLTRAYWRRTNRSVLTTVGSMLQLIPENYALVLCGRRATAEILCCSGNTLIKFSWWKLARRRRHSTPLVFRGLVSPCDLIVSCPQDSSIYRCSRFLGPNISMIYRCMVGYDSALESRQKYKICLQIKGNFGHFSDRQDALDKGRCQCRSALIKPIFYVSSLTCGFLGGIHACWQTCQVIIMRLSDWTDC